MVLVDCLIINAFSYLCSMLLKSVIHVGRSHVFQLGENHVFKTLVKRLSDDPIQVCGVRSSGLKGSKQ